MSGAGEPAPYEVVPIAWVESTLVHIADAPNQQDEGAPPAWLVFEPQFAEGIRDLRVGEPVIVLSWLHRAARDVLSTVPGDDPGGPERGVFSTRSPDRPNPIGVHRVRVMAIDGLRILVDALEVVSGTPILDLKPVIDRSLER